MRHPYGITITVERQAYDERTGDPIGDPVPHTVDDCAFNPGGSTEVNSLGQTVTTRPTIYGPYDADVLATDKLYVPGDTKSWEVEGDVARFHNPFTGDEPGCVVGLTRSRGA